MREWIGRQDGETEVCGKYFRGPDPEIFNTTARFGTWFCTEEHQRRVFLQLSAETTALPRGNIRNPRLHLASCRVAFEPIKRVF